MIQATNGCDVACTGREKGERKEEEEGEGGGRGSGGGGGKAAGREDALKKVWIFRIKKHLPEALAVWPALPQNKTDQS